MVAVARAPAPAAAAAGRASASASGVRANAPPARRGAVSAAGRAGRLGRDAPAPLARRAPSLVARSSSAEAERGTAPAEGDAPSSDRVVRLAFTMPGWTGEGRALVVGSAPALGDWDPDVGLEMRGCQRDPSGAPDAWTGLVKLPAGAEGEYKVVIRASDRVDRWSPDDNALLPTDDESFFPISDETSETLYDQGNDGGTVAVATRRASYEEQSSKLARVSFDDVLPRERPDAVLATVVFRAEASLRPGQRLVVAGNCPELGYWRPQDSAATMAWSEGDRWTAAVKFDAFKIFGAVDATSAAAWLDFKPVIVDDARGGAETWLDGDNFRVRRLPGPDAVAALNDWLAGEHYAATLGAPSADGAGVADLPGAGAGETRAARDWARAISVEIVGAGSAMTATSAAPALPTPAPAQETPAQETLAQETPEQETPAQDVAEDVAVSAAVESPEEVLERLKNAAADAPAAAEAAAGSEAVESPSPEAELLSKADRALESAAAAADESTLLEKAERVLADAAAVATEAAREMSAPGVTLSFVRDPEDKARLARALRGFDGGAPKLAEPAAVAAPKASPASASAYGGGTVIKKAPASKKTKKGGFLWWNASRKEDAAEDSAADASEDDPAVVAEDAVTFSFDEQAAPVSTPPPAIATAEEALIELMDADEDPSIFGAAVSATNVSDFEPARANTVVFTVVSQLEVGETLVVVGNVPELGGWTAELGAKMTWGEGNVWTTAVDIPIAPGSDGESPPPVEFKLVRLNEATGAATWQEGDNFVADLLAGKTVDVDVPNAFVQSLSVETVRQTSSFSPELAAARAREMEETLVEEKRLALEAEKEKAEKASDGKESFEAVTYRFEDVPAEEIVFATTRDDEPAADLRLAEEFAEVASDEQVAVVAAMKAANAKFEEAAARARAAADRANAKALELRAVDQSSEAFELAQAEVEELSEEALAAVRAAKLAKEEATSTTSAVAALAREEAEAAAKAAEAAAAVAAAAADADDVTAADLRAREEKLSATAAEKAAKAQRKAVEAQNLASFEFPEFQVPEISGNAKVGGAAVVGALGVAGLAAEADLASSLMQVGGEAAMTTAFAFLFANNMVFAKDREKLMGSLESREQFEKFILSGQWMGKDSFAGEVAKEALVVFDPLGIAEETLKREKATEKATKKETKAEEPKEEDQLTEASPKAETEEELPEEDPEAAKSEAKEATADASPAKPAPERDEKTASWSHFFSGKKRETQTLKETKAGGQLNDVVAIPRNAQPGDDEMEDAFMAFGAPTRKRPPPGFAPPGAEKKAEAKKPVSDANLSVSEPEPAKGKPRGVASAPVGLPSGKRGVSSFLNSRAGASSFASTKPADPNSVEAIQYRKDMANAKAAGVPYSSWVKKSREDLSTLTWQELAERMKKPYDPEARDFTDDAGAR